MAESCFTDRVCIGELFEIHEKMGDVISSAWNKDMKLVAHLVKEGRYGQLFHCKCTVNLS